MIKRVIIGIACGLLWVPSLRAQYNTLGNFNQESPSMNRSVRALGMGNAYIAAPGNVDSPHYNPAGLNDITDGKFQLLSPTAELSKNSFGLVSDIQDLIDDLDAANTDSEKVDVMDDFVQERFGEFNSVRFQVNIASWVGHNFAAGALLEQRAQLAVRDQSLPKFDVLNISDLILYGSIAHNFWEKLLQVGMTVKPIFRSAVKESITATTAINDEVDDVFQTLLFPHFGIAFDFGLKTDLSFPGLMKYDGYKRFCDAWQPSFAFTWQDIGNTAFNTNLRATDGDESGVEDPTKFVNAVDDSPVDNEQSMSVGLAAGPKLGIVKTTMTMDFRDLNQDSNFIKKFHIGMEAQFPKIVALRAGFSQGYFAGGIGLDLWIVNVDFASYEEEVGVFGSHNGNRRYAVSLNFGI